MLHNVMLFAIALTYATDSPERPPEEDSACRVECTVSPRPIVERYVRALLSGDKEGVRQVFPTETAEGRVVAEAHVALAEMISAMRRFEQKVLQKYDEGTLKRLEGVLGWQLLTYDDEGITNYIKTKVQVFIREDGRAALAQLPEFREEFLALNWSDGVWCIAVDKVEAIAMNRFPDAIRRHQKQLLSELDEVLAESRSSDEFLSMAQMLAERRTQDNQP